MRNLALARYGEIEILQALHAKQKYTYPVQLTVPSKDRCLVDVPASVSDSRVTY